MGGVHAGDMVGEVALAIKIAADTADIGKTIHPPRWAGGRSGARFLPGCATSTQVRWLR